jgi:Fur family ferric uptake transcriptional regulator
MTGDRGPRTDTAADPSPDRDGTSPAHRRTRQRQQIYDALAKADGFVTAQELHARLRREGATVGLATVYRGLQLLADSKEADAVRRADGETAYRRCSPTHHHHLICRSCGRTIEFEAAPIESWAADVAARYGFRDIAHVVEIDGLCPNCSCERGSSAALGYRSGQPTTAASIARPPQG